MDHGCEAGVGFAASHCHSLEFLQLAKEVFDEVPPFIDLTVDVQRSRSVHLLRDDDLGSALVQFGDDPVCIKRFVCDQPVELYALDKRCHPDGVIALAWQEFEPNKVAQRIGQCQNFRRQTATRLADGLALSPPFAP